MTFVLIGDCIVASLLYWLVYVATSESVGSGLGYK